MIPKKLHLYWGGAPFSFLRFLTIYSLRKLNPDYEINLYVPKYPSTSQRSWFTPEYINHYEGEDFLSQIKDLCNIIEVSLNEIGFTDTANEIIKSDVFRNYIIYKEGGIFIDTDILFFKSLPEFNCSNFICYLGDLYAIGFIGGEQNSKLYGNILLEQLKKSKNITSYQEFGNMMYKISSIELMNKYPNTILIDKNLVYPIPWNYLNDIFINNIKLPEICIGLHWFGGSSIAAKYENKMIISTWQNYNNTLSSYIKILNSI